MTIEVRYTKSRSHEGYVYKEFHTYEEFGKWVVDNFDKVNIWSIRVRD